MEAAELLAAVRRGQAFQTDAANSSPALTYIAGFDWKMNFPAKSSRAATVPNANGPYPLRLRERNASDPTATTRNVAVSGSRYAVFIRKAKPIELMSPA